MSERRYTREEAMEALRAASESGGGDDDLVTESELLAMAGEMGVDSEQLRAVLARGTGSVQGRDNVATGWGWPGNETFERVIDGELSPGQLEEVAELAGGRYEDGGTPGVRETREFWEGWRYVTLDVTARGGRTRILAKSKISYMRLSPFFPLLAIACLMFFTLMLKENPANLEQALQGVISMGLLFYFGVGWGMRLNRKRILARVEELAASVQEQVRGQGALVVGEEELEDRLGR
ncbi:hypothetical protein CCB80_07105 [Armatimonadetes bacterium Uphvl-Ar1]|nr:hypothetical protein CCB80_07105 [Armatimonadetes bacterium Uphvl-Ar1]